MTDEPRAIRGDVQAQVMSAIWRRGAATVEQVRDTLPERYRGGYTTVQTTLNRLASRGLLTRERVANVIVYRPTISEADHLSQHIARMLARASSDARQTVLARLVSGLSDSELTELRRLGRTARRDAGGR